MSRNHAGVASAEQNLRPRPSKLSESVAKRIVDDIFDLGCVLPAQQAVGEPGDGRVVLADQSIQGIDCGIHWRIELRL